MKPRDFAENPFEWSSRKKKIENESRKEFRHAFRDTLQEKRIRVRRLENPRSVKSSLWMVRERKDIREV